MLYDPKWEKTTKAAPFTLEGLIAWLERQPPESEYSYFDCSGGCLYGQYMKSVGVNWELARRYGEAGRPDTYKEFRALVYFPIAANEPHTFGAALERARAVLASRP